MIVTGGENVYSVEVENAIASHPAVAQVAVIGIPHEPWGEAVHAIVVLKRRRRRDRGRAQGARPRADRRLQGAEVGRVPHRAAPALGRDEGAQARAARALLGGQGAKRPLTPVVSSRRRTARLAPAQRPARTRPATVAENLEVGAYAVRDRTAVANGVGPRVHRSRSWPSGAIRRQVGSRAASNRDARGGARVEEEPAPAPGGRGGLGHLRPAERLAVADCPERIRV